MDSRVKISPGRGGCTIKTEVRINLDVTDVNGYKILSRSVKDIGAYVEELQRQRHKARNKLKQSK